MTHGLRLMLIHYVQRDLNVYYLCEVHKTGPIQVNLCLLHAVVD